MNLYTFILDYIGGTYISQVKARNLTKAVSKWPDGLVIDEIKGLGPNTISLLKLRLTEDRPVPLSGLINAWCMSTIIRGRLVLIHIVETEKES
jgi:hypothetical protein